MMFLYKMCVSCLPIYAMWKGPRNSDGFWVRHIFLGPGHHRTLHPSFVGKHHVIVVYIYLDYRSVVSGGVLWEEGNLPQHLIGFHLFFPKKDGYFWHVYRFFSHENWKPLLFIGFFPKMMGFHSFFPIKIALFGAFPYFPAPPPVDDFKAGTHRTARANLAGGGENAMKKDRKVNYELYSNTFYLFFGDTYNSCCCFWHVRFSNGFWLMGLLVLILNVFVFGECVGVFVLSDNDSQLTEAHKWATTSYYSNDLMKSWVDYSTRKMKAERDHVIAVSQAWVTWWNIMEQLVFVKWLVKDMWNIGFRESSDIKSVRFSQTMLTARKRSYVRYDHLVGGLEPCMEFYIFPIILGISYSQLTNSIISQRGRLTTNQIIYH